MTNKTLFTLGEVKFTQKTILTIFGVALGIYLIKRMSQRGSTTTIITEEEGYENYVDENFFNYVDEGFMGMGGDESMKFGGGKPIAFAQSTKTDSAIYEPNFYNSDGKVPIATDEPNFANSDGQPHLDEPASPVRPTIDSRKGKTRMRFGDRGNVGS